MNNIKQLYINKPQYPRPGSLYYNGSNKWRLRAKLWEAFELGLLRCGYCSKSFNLLKNDYPTLDHIIPSSRGGSNNILNLTPCCSSCNTKKGFATWEVKYPTPFFGVEGKKRSL